MSEISFLQKSSSIARFRVTKFQYFLFSIATVSILTLGFFSITQSNSTIKEAKVLSDVETPAASIIFTQRETLVYATRLAQWSNGGTTRRSVQIARSILAQRLAVIDTSGLSMGSRARSPYWEALRSSDRIVAAAPSGILPGSLHSEINQKIAPIIDEILAQSRELVVSYQRSVDKELVSNARETAERNRLNLIFFYIFIVTGSLFLLLNVRTNFKNYRIARNIIIQEQKVLDSTLAELHKTQSTVVKLQDLNDAKTAFVSTVNHELRTPLTSIIGYIDLIRETREVDPAADINQYFDVLDRNAQILLHVVESILSISKIDASKNESMMEKIQLNEVIDNSIFIMKPALEKSEQSVTFTATEEIFIEGDRGQLSQVFINLIGNAHKFSPRNSSIEIMLDSVTLKHGIEYARISICDHGIGIPKEDIESLSIRFFRAKNADSGQYPGTGLGLAIVRQILDLHHGKFSITSTLGEGTTITLLIPLYLSNNENLIRDRSAEVLARAINSLEEASLETAEEVTHTIGGVLGFYGLEDIGDEILKYSRLIESGVVDEAAFRLEQKRFLSLLRDSLSEMGSDENE